MTGTGQIKFVPLAGQDQVTKNGVQTTINTSHQVITSMKEYETKSLEELRLEDYQANRKFPQNQSSFGTPTSGLFSSTGASSGGGFGTSTSSGIFGSTPAAQNKPLFGATTPSTTGIFGQSSQNTANRSFFGAATTTQPTATTSTFGGFGTQSATQVIRMLFFCFSFGHNFCLSVRIINISQLIKEFCPKSLVIKMTKKPF